MDSNLLRNQVWESLIRSDINARYWMLYETRCSFIEKIVRVVLILGSLSSIIAWALRDEYLPVATAISSFAAIIVLVIVPVFGLEGYVERLIEIRRRWVSMRKVYRDLWDEIESGNDGAAIERRFKKANEQREEIRDIVIWSPKSKTLTEEAHADTERLLVAPISLR